MKSIYLFLITPFVSISLFAGIFKATGTVTVYYYQPYSSLAAEASMWKNAFMTCSKKSSKESILPLRLSEVKIYNDEIRALITASAEFKCLDAEGRDIP